MLLAHQRGRQLFLGAFSPNQRLNLQLRTSIKFCDDCSGARAPYEALCQLVTKLAIEDIVIDIEDMFASNCPGTDGDGPVHLLRRNASQI